MGEYPSFLGTENINKYRTNQTTFCSDESRLAQDSITVTNQRFLPNMFGAMLRRLCQKTIVQAIPENTIILFICPPKFYIGIVFVFSWDHCKSQEKLETMLMQNFGAQTKSIMAFSEMTYFGMFPLWAFLEMRGHT